MSEHDSNETLAIHLRDLGKPLIDAWHREFAGIPSVHASCGDIFSTKTGQIAVDDPIDVKADAIVSPANSFGFMDGGIDAVYTYQFGDGLQQRLQEVIERDFAGELPVGMAVVVQRCTRTSRGASVRRSAERGRDSKCVPRVSCGPPRCVRA